MTQPRFTVNLHSRTLGGSKHISSAFTLKTAEPNRSVGIDEFVRHETELERGAHNTFHDAPYASMKTPVSVLRLPRGPDPNSRGFDPNSPRFLALCPATVSASSAADAHGAVLRDEQRARSLLRERFLRSLLAMCGRPVRFSMYEKVQVEAKFGASDIDVLNFQVSDLQTPIGVQKEALLRCPDIITYSFDI
ncbi:gem-associated protein 7 isoform X2 [Brienomyrus brachyistius]|uniref:gem-associated protein 7 isoform X2 n=1 Tax=Brienomyrus brachyistius TaxID=42636 RepID=UPI0020B433C0|nr:gem-associated protein 7 isoform X2 [Brienomyrus brachyistius]